MILVIILGFMICSLIMLINAFSLFDNNDLYIIICCDKKCNKTYLKVYKNYNYNYVMKLIDWCLHENIDFKAYYYKNGKIKELDLL